MNGTKRNAAVAVWVVAGLLMGANAVAQKTTSAPATDSAAQSSPLQPAPKVPATDAAAESSPEIGPVPKRGTTIAPGTAIHAVLARGIDSGSLKNGQKVRAKLSAALKTSSGSLPAGTPVVIEVVGTVPAGELTAVGEFSLQVDSVGSVGVMTEIKTYRGEPGKREVADAAPAVGTNAGLAAGAAVVFQVSKPATAATDAPKADTRTPGSVDQTASGSQGKARGGSNSGQPTYGSDQSVLGSQGLAGQKAAPGTQSAAPSGQQTR